MVMTILPMEIDQMTSDLFHHRLADMKIFSADSSRSLVEQTFESDDPEWRTLEDDPAFSRLLDSLDEYARASERSARRSFVCAVVSSVGTVLALAVAIVSLVISSCT